MKYMVSILVSTHQYAFLHSYLFNKKVPVHPQFPALGRQLAFLLFSVVFFASAWDPSPW